MVDIAPGTPHATQRAKGDGFGIRRSDGCESDDEAAMVAAVCEEQTPIIDVEDLIIPGRAYYDLISRGRLDQTEVMMARKLMVDKVEVHEVYEWARIETVGDVEAIDVNGRPRQRCTWLALVPARRSQPLRCYSHLRIFAELHFETTLGGLWIQAIVVDLHGNFCV